MASLMGKLGPLVLAAALSAGAYAGAAVPGVPAVHLDRARLFDPAAESIITFAAFVPQTPGIADDVFALRAPFEAFLEPVAALIGTPSYVAMQPIALVTAPSANLPSQALETPRLRMTAQLAQAPIIVPSLSLSAIPSPAFSAPPGSQAVAEVRSAVHFGRYRPYVPDFAEVATQMQTPMRLGGLHWVSGVQTLHAQADRPDAFRELELCGTTDAAAPCPYLAQTHDDGVTAVTHFDINALGKRVRLSVTGSVEQISTADTAMFQYQPLDPDPHLGLTSAQSAAEEPLLYYPGVSDLVKHGISAAVAVPISHAITLGLQYDAQHYQGVYASTAQNGLDAYKQTYLGNVTYAIPRLSSAITLSARQSVYQNAVAPQSSLTQTRADLDFTVKF